MSTAFFIPALNLMGAGCLTQAADAIQSHGFKKALIVTDKVINSIGMVVSATVNPPVFAAELFFDNKTLTSSSSLIFDA